MEERDFTQTGERTKGTTGKTPNFLVIGAAKSGTTALWQYLRQHPEVYVAGRKHVRHFSFPEENPTFAGPPPSGVNVPYAVVDDGQYERIFDDVVREKARGEASHSYLYQARAAREIHKYRSDMKLVAILRHPTDRAFSHYRQMVRDGREYIDDFEEALGREEERKAENFWPDFHYKSAGLYREQLERYFGLFERDLIRIYLYEDLKSGPLVMLADLFRFLGVNDTFEPVVDVRYNASGMPKNRILHGALQGIRGIKPLVEKRLPERYYRKLLEVGSRVHNGNLKREKLDEEVRRRTTELYFRDDIERLQVLIGRDLSGWLN